MVRVLGCRGYNSTPGCGLEPPTFRFSGVGITVRRIPLTSAIWANTSIRTPMNAGERRWMRPPGLGYLAETATPMRRGRSRARERRPQNYRFSDADWLPLVIARTGHLNRPVRAALATWVRPACLLLIYLGSTAQPWFHGGWCAAATFALAGLGFVVAMLVKHVTPQHRHTPEDRNRLDVLTLQALAAFLMGWTVDAIWHGVVVGRRSPSPLPPSSHAGGKPSVEM